MNARHLQRSTHCPFRREVEEHYTPAKSDQLDRPVPIGTGHVGRGCYWFGSQRRVLFAGSELARIVGSIFGRSAAVFLGAPPGHILLVAGALVVSFAPPISIVDTHESSLLAAAGCHFLVNLHQLSAHVILLQFPTCSPQLIA